MLTETRIVDPANPDPAAIGRAAAVIRAGGLVAFPTETVYGLGANALDPAAVGRIFTAKGRPATNPVIVHVADPEQVLTVAAEWPVVARKLAERFWPGPLTLVVPKRPDVPDVVTAGGPTVAIRCPAHPVAQSLIRAAGVPLAAPSANRSTELSPTRADHVLKGLSGRIEFVLDGGPCPGGIESTVADVTGGTVRVLRPGLVTVPMLEAVAKVTANREQEERGPARSPGQMAKHYSPKTPMMLVNPDSRSRAMETLRDAGKRFILWELPTDPVRAAAILYDQLHQLDRRGCDAIVIEFPPDADTPEWDAIQDRLTRAAAHGIPWGLRGGC